LATGLGDYETEYQKRYDEYTDHGLNHKEQEEISKAMSEESFDIYDRFFPPRHISIQNPDTNPS
jgi:hypothetical protein